MLGRTSKRLAAGVIVGLLAVAAPPTLAPAAMGQGEASKQALIWDARRNVAFEGGSFAEFIESLRGVWPEVNLVVTDSGLESIRVPSITLRNVDVTDAIQVAYAAIDQEDARRLTRSGPGTGAIPLHGAVITLGTRRLPRSQEPASTHTWSVANLLLRDIDQEQMLTAIKTALELGDGEDVTLRLHPPTGLLIARGAGEQMRTIDEVIDRLEDSASATAQHSQPSDEIRVRDSRIQALSSEVQQQEIRLNEAVELVRELKIERQQLKAALLDLERRNARLEAELRSVREQAEEAKQRAADLSQTIQALQRKLAEKDG